ncbi:hypothetical protein AVEN_70181-1 [Araneus ventricosus]|uniref:Uncharacterized protein n=1 Tax=Araneus ventricosus TaxID=182803 RepID=A0A4Y2FET0_ARAVE|nr:hypothetical protein AVEN_70181-1 [Araneus ventricosus]
MAFFDSRASLGLEGKQICSQFSDKSFIQERIQRSGSSKGTNPFLVKYLDSPFRLSLRIRNPRSDKDTSFQSERLVLWLIAEELGETVPDNAKICDLKHLIENTDLFKTDQELPVASSNQSLMTTEKNTQSDLEIEEIKLVQLEKEIELRRLPAKAFLRKPFRKPLPQGLLRKAFHELPHRQGLNDKSAKAFPRKPFQKPFGDLGPGKQNEIESLTSSTERLLYWIDL